MNSSRRSWWAFFAVIAAAIPAPLLLIVVQAGVDPRTGDYTLWSVLQALTFLVAAACFAYPARLRGTRVHGPHPAVTYATGLVCWIAVATVAWNAVIVHLAVHLAIPAVLLGCALVVLALGRPNPPEGAEV